MPALGQNRRLPRRNIAIRFASISRHKGPHSAPGSSLHLFAELFKSAADVDFVHIPYRGDAPMITALITGDIQLAFLPQANAIANVKGNLIRGLAVTGAKRMDALPDVPTAREQGIIGLEGGSWNAMFSPPARRAMSC